MHFISGSLRIWKHYVVYILSEWYFEGEIDQTSLKYHLRCVHIVHRQAGNRSKDCELHREKRIAVIVQKEA